MIYPKPAYPVVEETYIEVPTEQTRQELIQAVQMVARGYRVRTYLMQKFITVTNSQNEYNYGYEDKKGDILYF